MFIKSFLFSLLYLINNNIIITTVDGQVDNIYTNDLYKDMVSKDCDYNTKDKCIDNWSCMWCNHTITNNTYYYKNNTNNTQISNCRVIDSCDFNKKNSNCIYSSDYRYSLHCSIIEIFFYTMLFIGYYFSMIVIYGTVNRLLLNDTVTPYTRNTINTLILLILTVPLFLFMYMDTLIFYSLFMCYIFIALFAYCCIKIKDKDKDLNLIKQIKPPSYSVIN